MIILKNRSQFEVFKEVQSGKTIAEIAMKIFVGVHGVKYRLSLIYKTTGCKNLKELRNLKQEVSYANT